MPEFVLQLEQMSGLPAWSLLLIAALVLLVFALAVSLMQARRRMDAVALQDNLNTLRKDVPDAVDPLDAGETSAVADAPEEEQAAEAPAEVAPAGALADEPGGGPAAYEPDEPADAPLADEPEPAEAADNPEEAEPADEPAEAGPQDELADEPAGEPAKSNTQHAWNVEEAEPVDAAWDIDDREIAKAAAGNHGRFGQSPFGIDFGFLEEYEEQYETALSEFQRLREKYRS